MAVVDVVVPAVGESVQEGMVYKWHKSSGEFVELDDVLVELETDKATVEIVAEASGVLEQKVKEGDGVKVGDVLGTIDTAAEKSESKPAREEKTSEQPKQEEIKPTPASAPQQTVKTSAEKPLSPAVNRMVREHELDVGQIPATGKNGRITKADVINHLEAKPSTPEKPAARQPSHPSPAGERGVRREPMSMLRRRIAERLIEAQQTNAILTTFNEVDMSAIMRLRKQYKESFKEQHGVGLGFMSFFVKAAVEALKQFPRVNGHIEGSEIVYYDYYDIGVAISTDRGLMVPVVRNCETLSFAEIEAAIIDYANKARNGKIALDDLSGGTFTVTNGGVFGSLLSTPIINPPQSGILGMHKIQERAMVVDGEIVVRPMMYLALSYDHRIIDGKEAVSFLVKLKDCIEDPARLLLGV